MRSVDIILNRIRSERAHAFDSLGLPADWIAPNYGGRSVANVPASIVRMFGAVVPAAPLDSHILPAAFLSGVERVVSVIVDALGYQALLDVLAANPRNGFHPLLRAGARLGPLTSVFPSTTTAALTSLWTGYTPAEHGFLGYQLFLRDYGVRADMIYFTPTATRELASEQLLQVGLKAEEFLPIPSLPQTLEPAGVPVYHVIALPYVSSALSRVQIRGAREINGVISSSDMWLSLRQMIEQHVQERALFSAYWGSVDGVAHRYGPSSPKLAAEINNLAYSFDREFLRPLGKAARRGTLFLLTADHGQIDTPPDRQISLRAHPELRSHLIMDFAGESRAAYLYCRNGEKEAAREYIQTHLDDQLLVLDARRALDGGLFGGGPRAPETPHRIGDWIVLPRENYTLVEGTDEHPLLGRHGGLTPAEMLVPLIAARLDA